MDTLKTISLQSTGDNCLNILPSKRIKILPENIANQIAAGEVVERPASVLKELVENSIDAGSDLVFIHIRAGGKQQIVVQDNGWGMNKDDVLLALERHATSKISDYSDLDKIETLGFRGEALPSIASVSRLTIDTKRREDSTGTRVYISGGELKDYRETGCPDGTRVEVRGLFFNTPARRKFLKSVTTEFNHIRDLLQVISLVHPGIHFRAHHNNMELFNYPAVLSLEQRLANIFGSQFLAGMNCVEKEHDQYSIMAYLGIPTNTRSTRDLQYIFVNNRPVKNKVLNHAIYEAYQDSIPKGRHPVYMVFLRVPYSEVDVNVHPSKIEIRFRRSSMVHDFVRDTIREVFGKPSPPGISQGPGAEKLDNISSRSNIQIPVFQKGLVKETKPGYVSKPSTSPRADLPGWKKTLNDQELPWKAPSVNPVEEQGKLVPGPSETRILHELSSARLIGQLHHTYILLEHDDHLLIIDQHTAHERILFSKFMDLLESGGIKSQGLLFPITVTVSPGNHRTALSNLKMLKAAGFEVEEFGSGSLVLRTAPENLGDRDPQSIFLDILAEIRTLGAPESTLEIRREMARILACRSAVKAGDNLEQPDMEHLVNTLCQQFTHYTCPHGRPIIVRYPIESIQKAFGR